MIAQFLLAYVKAGGTPVERISEQLSEDGPLLVKDGAWLFILPSTLRARAADGRRDNGTVERYRCLWS